MRILVNLAELFVAVVVFAVGAAVVGVPIAVVIAVLALIPALIARHKHLGAYPFWLFGFLLLPVAFLVAVFSRDYRRHCPYCDEPVRDLARVCPHCQRSLGAAAA
jgi:hypothetical protein